MTKYLSILMTAFFATAALSLAAPDKDALLAKENAAWQAFKDKKADDFKKVVSANMVAVYADGFADMAEEVAEMQKWDMKSFAISDFKIVAFGADTAISTYMVNVTGTHDGQDASGKMNASTVWKMEGGAWMAIFHTNVEAESPDAQKKE